MKLDSSMTLALLSLTSLASCGLLTDPAGEPDFIAEVEIIYNEPLAANTTASVLVLHPEAEEPIDRTIVHITKNTKIFFLRSSDILQTAGSGDLTPGTNARFWTTGYEYRTYPRQVIATRVEIIVSERRTGRT